MDTQTSNLTRAYRIQSFGNTYKLELEIYIDAGRDLTDTDNYNIREVAKTIEKNILQESIRLNPQSAVEAAKEKKDILGLFEERIIFSEEIPNGYCNEYCCKHLPWFVVTTNKGRIKIGWRKSVINIDWSDSIIKEKAETIFPNENVTKGDYIIHAWGLEKAKEYINSLLSL